MSLKLIREAQLVASLTAAELKTLKAVKEAIGANSIVDVVQESFTPTPEDFDTWMRVVVGEAQDRGVNINKKANFVQLVMDVLENDPAMPPIEMQEAIAGKLWQDYQAAKNEVRINKIAAAKEEEEKVESARKQIANRFAQGPTRSLSHAGEEEESGDTWGYKSNGIAVRLGDRKYAERHCREIGKTCIRLPALSKEELADRRRSSGQENHMLGNYEEEQRSMRPMGIEDEEHTSFLSDVLKTRSTRAGVRSPTSFARHIRAEFEDEARDEVEFDDDDLDVIDADPGVFTSSEDDLDTVDTADVSDEDGDECTCPCPDEETDVDFRDVESFGDDEFDDDTMDDVDADIGPRAKAERSYDEEEAVKSFFRQAATAPRNMMTQAIKDIESEGASAWKQANVPANPHPKKSAAHRAWQKGLLAAAKESLGIVDKPKDAKPKKKK